MLRAILLLAVLLPCRGEDPDATPINRLQFIGSHNSYRLRTHAPLLKFLMNMRGVLPGGLDPQAWDYEHEPFDAQLGAHHVRSLELDVYHDPAGGAFAKRQGNRLVGEPVESGDESLAKPGFKVLHFPDFDYRTNYTTLAAALAAVRKWSDANPRHEPVILHLETKDDGGEGRIPLKELTRPPKWDAAACDALDAEIRAVFDAGRIITPDALRGERDSLADAAHAGAWPKLADARGKVIFVMEGCAVPLYRRPGLKGRASFIYGKPGRDDTAFLLMNDPMRGDIAERVREGYFVRTRADAETREARSGETVRREGAFASGAQIVSTDYYRPDPRAGKEDGWKDYSVHLPGGGAVRGNPVNGAD
jgi:Phosphoinositide phospholipase C, Ca2+-dependent